MTLKIEYQKEMNKIKQVIIKEGILNQFNFHTIPIDFFLNLFKKNGFQETNHHFKKYGKKSYSLRKKIHNNNIHILLRQSNVYKWISLHKDSESHKTTRLNRNIREIICNNILS